MIEILSRPLPKKQIGRLLMVNLVVILILLAVPVRTSWNGYKRARDAFKEQVTVQGGYALRLGQARLAVTQQPVLLGEIRGAMALLTEGDQRLRPPSDAATILEEIRDLILGRSVDLLSLSQQEPGIESGYQIQQIVLTVQGTFNELLRLMHAIRHQETFLITDRMSLQIAVPDGRNPRLTLDANISTILVENLTPFSEITRMLGDSTLTAGEGYNE